MFTKCSGVCVFTLPVVSYFRFKNNFFLLDTEVWNAANLNYTRITVAVRKLFECPRPHNRHLGPGLYIFCLFRGGFRRGRGTGWGKAPHVPPKICQALHTEQRLGFSGGNLGGLRLKL